LFFVLAAATIFLAALFRIHATRSSLIFYVLLASWIIYVDTRSGEFLPALAKDSHWLILPIASLLFAQAFRTYPRAIEFLQIGTALCTINLLATMFVMAEWFDNWHYPPIFGHIRHLGLSIGFLSLILFTRTASSTLIAALFRVARILGLALVFWSGTRASILAWICCIAIFVLLDRTWLKTLLIDTTVAILISQIPPPAFPINQWTPGALARTVQELSGSATSATAAISMRLDIWRSTLSALIESGNLWTGFGGNGFARLQVIHGVQIGMRPQVHPHNAIVQILCDWGLIGLLLIFALLANSLVKPMFLDRESSDPMAVSGIAYLLVTAMFDATLYHLEHLTYFAIATGLLLRHSWRTSERAQQIHPALVIAMIAILAGLHLATQDYRIGLYWYFRTE
jgi:O-antigen ligase